jgi:hypothetical protein
MKKSMGISNGFCPQTLFVYGTYNDDGKPDFGLFCWVSYYWNEGLGVMAAICLVLYGMFKRAKWL